MSDMVETQVMHDQGRPIAIGKLGRNMARHILVYFHKVLWERSLAWLFEVARALRQTD